MAAPLTALSSGPVPPVSTMAPAWRSRAPIRPATGRSPVEPKTATMGASSRSSIAASPPRRRRRGRVAGEGDVAQQGHQLGVRADAQLPADQLGVLVEDPAGLAQVALGEVGL